MKNLIPLLFVIVALSSCDKTSKHSPTNQPEIQDFKIGEKWTWKWKRSIGGEVRAEGNDSKEVIMYNDTLSFAYHYDTVSVAYFLNQKASETPFRSWPLHVGKKWKYESVWTNESGGKGKTSQDVEVITFEEVETEAGKFWAYKIKYQGTVVNFNGGKAEVSDFWWYCPELRDYIKHTQDDGYGMYTSELSSDTQP